MTEHIAVTIEAQIIFFILIVVFDLLGKSIDIFIAERFQKIETKDQYVWRIIFWIIPIGIPLIFYRFTLIVLSGIKSEWKKFKELKDV